MSQSIKAQPAHSPPHLQVCAAVMALVASAASFHPAWRILNLQTQQSTLVLETASKRSCAFRTHTHKAVQHVDPELRLISLIAVWQPPKVSERGVGGVCSVGDCFTAN